MPLSCPKCQTPLLASREHAGQIVRCPNCQAKLRLPPAKNKPAAPAPAPLPVQSVPPEQQHDPLAIPISNDPLASQNQSLASPTNPLAPQVPQNPYGKSGFQKQKQSSGKPAAFYILSTLAAVLVLAVLGVVAYSVFSKNNDSIAKQDNSSKNDNEVKSQKIVLPGGGAGSAEETAGSIPQPPPQKGALSGDTRLSDEKNLSHFNGLFTDNAPTNSKTSSAKSKYQYSNREVTNFELGEGWRDFVCIGNSILNEKSEIPQDIREQATDLCARIIDNAYTLHGNSSHLLVEEIDELVKNKELADDPYFLHICTQALLAAGSSERAFGMCIKALKGYKDSNYPARLPVMLHTVYDQIAELLPPPKNPDSKLEERIDATIYWLEHDFQATEFEHRFVFTQFENLIDAVGEVDLRYVDQLIDRLETSGTFPDWLRFMCKGIYLKKKAWAARGSGFANTVTKAGWEQFRKNHEMAEGYFIKAIETNPKFPEAATQMIDIARAGNSKQNFEYWFEKAIDAQFDYQSAYNEMQFTLYPRWHGSAQELILFGAKCYETRRFDTMVPYVFIDSFFDVRDKVLTLNPAQKRSLSKDLKINEALLACLEELNADPSPKYVGLKKLEPNYLPTLEAMLAYELEDYATAQSVFNEIGDNLNPVALKKFNMNRRFDDLRSKAHAMNGKFRKEALELEKLWEHPAKRLSKKDEIAEIIDNVLNAHDDSPGKIHFEAYRDRQQAENNFVDGKWVNLKFDNSLWSSMMFGFCEVLSSSELIIDNTDKKSWAYALESQISLPSSERLNSKWNILRYQIKSKTLLVESTWVTF